MHQDAEQREEKNTTQKKKKTQLMHKHGLWKVPNYTGHRGTLPFSRQRELEIKLLPVWLFLKFKGKSHSLDLEFTSR